MLRCFGNLQIYVPLKRKYIAINQQTKKSQLGSGKEFIKINLVIYFFKANMFIAI